MIIGNYFVRTDDEVGKPTFLFFGVLMSINSDYDNDQDVEINEESTGAKGWLKKVETLAAGIAEREGCVLYDIEFVSRVLRVYIDKEPSAGIKDCENVSKGLSLILDVENIVPGEHYQLEVSTPGLERVLKKDWHFERAIGKKIRVKTNTNLENVGVVLERWKKAKTIEQKLKAVKEKSLVFETQEGDVVIPLAAVEKAKVIFELEKTNKKKH